MNKREEERFNKILENHRCYLCYKKFNITRGVIQIKRNRFICGLCDDKLTELGLWEDENEK